MCLIQVHLSNDLTSCQSVSIYVYFTHDDIYFRILFLECELNIVLRCWEKHLNDMVQLHNCVFSLLVLGDSTPPLWCRPPGYLHPSVLFVCLALLASSMLFWWRIDLTLRYYMRMTRILVYYWRAEGKEIWFPSKYKRVNLSFPCTACLSRFIIKHFNWEQNSGTWCFSKK